VSWIFAACIPFAEAKSVPPMARLVPMVSAQGLSRETYLETLDIVRKGYTADFAGKGLKLKVNDLWSDHEVNASAWPEGIGNRTRNVDAYGGMARAPGMTKLGYLVILCHELGHHIAGGETYPYPDNWASCEGESDYFATHICMKKLGFDSTGPGLRVAEILAGLAGEPRPSRMRPNKSKVSKTYCEHPDADCRLVTFDEGKSCRKNSTCHKYDTATNPIGKGNRPRCWYAP
jgi:hypothetical protein